MLRPLSDRGCSQAGLIAEALAARPVRRILSSPAVRCIKTVQLLGRELGLAVQNADELCEGSYASDAFKLICALANEDGDSVLCSHGDVIPGVLWLLARRGVDLPVPSPCKKASIWELSVQGGQVMTATYQHPPSP